MKNFLKKALIFFGIVFAVFSFTTLVKSDTFSNSAFADDSSGDTSDCRHLLGMVAWDCGLATWDSQDNLVKNIAKIATNILTDGTVIAAYLVLGYVIWGGYLYMFSSGDPGKAAAGKKTLVHAFIGLAITLSAYTIFGGIRTALIGNTSLSDCSLNECVTPDQIVTNTIQWVAGMGGVVAVVFVVVGAWGYITANGDPGKLQKAKTTILYALIGLVIVALAEVITAFVSSTIRNANNNSYLDTPKIIANINKEPQ